MKMIGKYEVVGLLGRGGMGAVYKVRLPAVGKVLALKLLAPRPELVGILGREEVRRLFIHEAVIMGRIRHPNLVEVWDFEDAPPHTFLVMEYYCRNLGAMIGETYDLSAPARILSLDKAVHYARQVLSGLDRLHYAGLVHRDIKPFNLLLTDQDTVKITDFGLSRLRGEVRPHPPQLKIGSPHYTAPEQEKNPEQAGPRSDLYAVGVMLRRMLTGRLPADQKTEPSRINKALDEDWDAFLAKAAHPNPKERFPGAREMIEALNELQAAWTERREKVCRFQAEPAFSAPVKSIQGRILRSRPIKVPPGQARKVFGLDELGRPSRSRGHEFQVRPDGTVCDRTAGLVWQRSGSDYPLTWTEAGEYVDRLNRKRWADRTDWRLPTVDELLTLLLPPQIEEDYCLEPVFDREKKWLWSADRRSALAAWSVSADLGYVDCQDFTCPSYVRPVSSAG